MNIEEHVQLIYINYLQVFNFRRHSVERSVKLNSDQTKDIQYLQREVLFTNSEIILFCLVTLSGIVKLKKKKKLLPFTTAEMWTANTSL